MRRKFQYKGKAYHLIVERVTPRIFIIIARSRPPRSANERAARKIFPDGAVIITRRGRNGRIIPQVYRNIFDAIRGRINIERRYGKSKKHGERAAIQEMIKEGRKSLKQILGSRASELEEEIVSKSLEDLYFGLDGSRNIWKEVAYEAICAAMSPLDSLGRYNPGVRSLHLSTGTRGLEMRALEIPYILPYISRDLLHLMQKRDQGLGICEQELAKFEAVLESWLFKGHSPAYRSKNFDKWINDRYLAIDLLTISPFIRTAYHVRKDLEEARNHGISARWAGVGAVVRRIIASLRLRLFQPQIEMQIARLNLILDILEGPENDREVYMFIDWSHGITSDLAIIRDAIRKDCKDKDFRNPVVRPILNRLSKATNSIYDKKWQAAKRELKAASKLI